jgi:cytochrome c
MLALLAVPPAQAQDKAAGQAVFKAQCSICHATEPEHNMTGPTLYDVVGRPAGHVAGFAYSDANRNSGIVWSVEFDLYLTSPKGVVPHNAMTYGGVKDASKRADLIAYLTTLR